MSDVIVKRIGLADRPRPKSTLNRLPLLVLLGGITSCGGAGPTPPAPPPPPPPPVAPVQVGAIPNQAIATGQSTTLEVSTYFRDPDGGALTYTVASSAAGVVSVSLSGSTLTMVGVADGTATVTVTARDPDGLSATQRFEVTVETPNRAPEAVGTIPNRTIDAGSSGTVEVSSYFRDLDGDALTYTVASSAAEVVSVSLSGSTLTMVGVADGTATVTVTARDPDGLAATQGFEVTVETPNRAPEAVGTIPNRTIDAGSSETVDVSSFFRDPDGDELTYTASSSAPAVVSVSRFGSALTVTGIGPGTATVTVTAADRDGLTATHSFEVAVRGSFGDDFDSATSQDDWATSHNADVEVGSGVLSLTNRADDRLGIAERSSSPTVKAWSIQARMGRMTRRASPGIVSLTGHGRFTAARLVLATLDNADPDRSADGAATSSNYEFAVFDREAGDWIRINNMSGPSEAVRKEGGEFTDIWFGHEEGDFVAYAGERGSEELFRIGVDTSRLDGVVLGEVLSHLTGVWLVNQGAAGLTALHDWVRVSGTGSSATVPDGAEVAAAAAAAVRTVRVTGPMTNRAPRTVGTIPAQTVTTDRTAVVDVSRYFRDPDGDSLAYTAASSVSAVVSVSLSGSTLTLAGVAEGEATVTVTARDSAGLTAAQGFRVTATTPNRPPVAVGTIPPHRVSVGGTAAVPVTDHFSDPDGDRLTFAASSSNTAVARAAVSGSSVRISGVAAGTATVAVTAMDPGGLTATHGFRVTVVTLNQAPVAVGTIPGHRVSVRGTATVPVAGYFSDPDGDELSYSGSSSNGNIVTVSLDGATATVTGVAVGNAVVIITAADPDGLQANQGFQVTVTTSNRAPVAIGTIPPHGVKVGGTAIVPVRGYFSDADGDRLTFSGSSSNEAVAKVGLDGSTATVTGVARGTAVITITAADPDGLQANQGFNVIVRSG